MAYDNNINPGNPPLVWSRVRDAFDKINENFTILGTSLARQLQRDVAHIESGTSESNPVRIVTTEAHNIASGDRVFVFNTGVSQLDNNYYYASVISTTEFELYSDTGLTAAVDGTAYDSYSSGGGEIQALTSYSSLDFENMTTSISPNIASEYDLGTVSKPWQSLYTAEHADTDADAFNGVWLGSAQIKGKPGGIVDLPAGSTVDGSLIINPDQTFFKSVQIDSGDRVVADDFVDTLNLISGSAISMAVDSAAESITITNTGVTQLAAGSGVSVSSATGNITVANTGVLSVANSTTLPAIATGRTAGVGIITSTSTGALTLTNTGVIEVQAGTGITTFTDTATGIVTVTNGAPAGNAFRFIDVFGQTSLEANSVAGRLEFVESDNIIITTDGATDKVTFTFNNTTDIIGSVFADDSTKMVDAVENEMYASGGFFGNLTGDVTGNITGDVTGNVTGDLTGNSTGYHTGDVKGSLFADDSSLMVDAVDNKLYADEITTPQITATSTLTLAPTTDLRLNPTGAIYANTTLFDIAGPLTVSGTISGNLTGYQTGDMTGSVFADDSTKLVDAVEGKIVGPIESDDIRGTLIGTVYADDSTKIIDHEGNVLYTPSTPSDWNGTPPTTVGEALDRIAAKLKADSGTGA